MVMRQMRENTKWIMLVTALAFVALMVFEWGMDVSGRSAGGVGEIGRVNGTPVMYEEYLAVYRNLYDQVQSSQEEPITSLQVKELEDAAFEEMVNAILVRQELDRRGIRVTDEEIRQAAQFSPPPQLAQNPGFLTDGRFDFEKYQSFLASQADDAFLLQLEAYYRDIIPRSKLVRQISSGIYLPDNLLWQQYRDMNERVEIRYIPLDPAQRIPDSEVQVTDEQVQRYWNEHQEDFALPERARVQAAIITKALLPADSARARTHAAALLERISAGDETFADVALLESADEASAVEGGDLGVFFKGQMIPAFDSAAFAAPVGQVVGPVETQVGLHLIRVDERWAQDSVRAAHILVSWARNDSAEIALFTRADSLEALGEAMSVTEAAAHLGVDVLEAELTAEFAFLGDAGSAAEGADWALDEATVGEVSPVFETPQAFYMVELLERHPAGVQPLEEARETIEAILRFEAKMERSLELGSEVVERIRSGVALPNAAADAGLEVRPAGPFSRDSFVPGLGRFNAAIGTAFGLEVGQVSDVVRAEANAYIIELLNRIPADSTEWMAQRELQRQQARAQLEQSRVQSWLASLRATARVVDRRAEVLQPVDEDAPPPIPFGFGF